MRKTILIALFLGCLTSLASAEMKAGITVSGYQLDANGKESESGQSRSEDIAGATGSIFAEYSIDALNGVAIGLDIVPYDIDMGSVTNVRNGVTNGNQNNQSGTNSASVDMEYPITAYFLIPSEQGLYLKAGVSYANLNITESLTTNSTYPDQELFGGHINVGYEYELGGNYEYGPGEGAFIRIEAGYSEWETVKVKSSSGRNTVTADLDGMSARISIGKAF
tara:strand:- start:713 stop:1378 length:666 start_codon:yes stop_codon:yes gene_type:complete